MSRKLNKILSSILLFVSLVSPKSQCNAMANNTAVQSGTSNFSKKNIRKNSKNENLKKETSKTPYAIACLLSIFGIGGYKAWPYIKARLDFLNKNDIPKIINEVKKEGKYDLIANKLFSAYRSEKRELTEQDKNYINWVKSLPEDVIFEVSAGYLDTWEYLVDNLENKIDLEIYINFHDKTPDKESPEQGLRIKDQIPKFGVNDNYGSQQGIIEHEMKLKYGLPFEKKDAMGYFEKSSFWVDDNYIPKSNKNVKRNKKICSNLFMCFFKKGESNDSEQLAKYIQKSFGEYDKILNEIRSSNADEFEIGIQFPENDEDLRKFLIGPQRKIDFKFILDAFYLYDEFWDENSGKQLKENFKIKFANGKVLNYNEICELEYSDNTSYDNYFSKIKEFINFKKLDNDYQECYRYIFKNQNRLDKWKIENKIRKGTKDEKIVELIVRLCQALFQTHPFTNRNSRTHCVFLLNKLLIDNGFCPVIFDKKDERIFSGGDILTLIDIVRKSQQNFKKVCDEHGVKIPDYVKFL